MHVEIWSDVACPFCYIGKRSFEDALGRFEHRDEVEVTWRSFQLAPDMPATVDRGLDEILARKYGKTLDEARQMNEGVTKMAAEHGLEYHLDRARPANTRDAHRLLHHARTHGLADAVKERLLHGYFVDGEVVSDHDTLVRIGTDAGLDADDVRTLLASDDLADAVRSEYEEAQELGIGGVPAFVLDRRMLVTGAQPSDTLLAALRQAWESRQGAATT
ncbi:MAG: DsbA family oxidoreductase [Solirubrobacteraceae bacterium]|nr:DsbA family oxidoreductase [Solirubrobacteraceae bacterium]